MRERKRLEGWDQICHYLGEHRRTAERQAKRGMPVWGEGRRFAYTDQLDFWIANGRRRLEPLRALVAGNTLVTCYEGDHTLWTYEFPNTVLVDSPEELTWRVQITAFGDYGKCVLVVCRFRMVPGQESSDELFCFSAEGELLWRVPAEPTLVDGTGKPFAKSWRFKHLVVGQPGSAQAAWLAFANDTGWAGGILRVNPAGSPTVYFANAGHVERVALTETDHKQVLVFCGENNDFDQAFVACIEIDDPPGVSPPGRRLPYRYGNPPDGSPRKYVLFPRTELVSARDAPYGHAFGLDQYPDELVINVDTGGDGAYFLYHFTLDLQPNYVFPSGSHEFKHRVLETEGRITHAWKDCPEVRQPLPIDVWTPSRWRRESIRWRDSYPEGYEL